MHANVRAMLIALLVMLQVSALVGSSTPLPDDTTPPVTTIHVYSSEGENGWYVSFVTITFSAFDNESGVNYTYFKVNGGMWQIFTVPYTFGRDGVYTVSYYSVDRAGNVEDVKSLDIKIDCTVPVIIPLEHVSFTEVGYGAEASDAMSGINRVQFSINGLDNVVKNDTQWPFLCIFHHPDKNSTILAEAFDNAGNSAYCEPAMPGMTHVKGIVSNVEASNSSITFRAILTIYDTSGPLPPRFLLPRTFTFGGYDGEVNPHWIDIYLF